jgi:hypothetical protein
VRASATGPINRDDGLSPPAGPRDGHVIPSAPGFRVPSGRAETPGPQAGRAGPPVVHRLGGRLPPLRRRTHFFFEETVWDVWRTRSHW